MRAILGISCLLLGTALLLCQGESAGKPLDAKPQAAVRWVRTVDGWERPECWYSVAPGLPTLHPLVVAAGQGLLSVFGLALFQRVEH